MHDIRLLTDDDAAAAWALGSLSFGYHDRPMPEGWGGDAPGRLGWGVFDADGRMLGKAIDREQGHWFGGRVVPAAGVAGVATAAELRGGGIGRAMLTRLLRGARDRGAAISTLFDTTPVPYRRLGWEEVGALVRTAYPTDRLASVRRPAGTQTRPATEQDVPAIEELYREVARANTGMIERSGPVAGQTPTAFLSDWDGVTVAIDRTGIAGYACWDRGPGYDASGRLTVGELLGRSPEAVVALLAVIGGWAAVAPTVTLVQPAVDPVHLVADLAGAGQQERRQPWMLRIVNARDAVNARGYSRYVSGSVAIDLEDDECPWNAGPHWLVLDQGEARLEPGGPGGARFVPRGLALWYAGAATPSVLRRAGLLSGDAAGDELLAAATAGPAPILLDYF